MCFNASSVTADTYINKKQLSQTASQSFERPFGGIIFSSDKALEILALESVGFVCPMIGVSLSIIPIGSPAGTPVSYFISPFALARASGGSIKTGEFILGDYGGYTTVQCVHFIGAVIPVVLSNITVFGTSEDAPKEFSRSSRK